MNEEKFQFVLSAPVDKDGRTVKLTLHIQDSQILRLHHYPEFGWYVVGAFGILGGFLILSLIDSLLWVYCAILLAAVLYNIFHERAMICIINKKTGLISYRRSGVLMTSFDEKSGEYRISEIRRLEMHRHVKGGRWSWSLFAADTFQIFLLLDKGHRIPLSPGNLDFGECQELTGQISGFIGNEIPIKALD